VLVAQTIAQYRQTAYILKDSPTSSIVDSLTATLNNPDKKPSFIDTITVTDVSLGEEFPIFSNCRVIAVEDPNSDGGRLQALMDVDLGDDNLSMAIETSLILNYPKPFSAVLPVALAVSVVRFSGTLCISFVPASTPPSHTPSPSTSPSTEDPGTHASYEHDPGAPTAPNNSNQANPTDANNANNNNNKGTPKTNLAFSFLPDYRLELSVRSLIGSRSRLQDVPKVAQLVEARVQAWFEERVVEPRVQVVGLPGLWPRMGRTGVRGRGGSDAGSTATATVTAGEGPVRDIGGAGLSPSAADRNREMELELEGLRFRRGVTGGGNVNEAGTQAQRPGRQGDADGRLRMPGSMPEPVSVT
jgi:maintenance of morphology protein 1